VGHLYEGQTAIGMPLVVDVVSRADEIDEPGWVVWAATGAQAIGDEPRAEALLRRAIALARASGAVDELTYVLLAHVLMGLLGGRFEVAAEAAEGAPAGARGGAAERREHPSGHARVVRRAPGQGRRVPDGFRGGRRRPRRPAAARSRTRSPNGAWGSSS
jgi:hypothetical protein